MESFAGLQRLIRSVSIISTKTLISTVCIFSCITVTSPINESDQVLYRIQPEEIYHLAAQSHVRVSFDIPEYTGDVTGLGTIRILGGDSRDWTEDEILSGKQLGDVRQSSRNAATGDDSFLPAKPLWGSEGLCLLDNGQLPGELRYLCLQRHSV